MSFQEYEKISSPSGATLACRSIAAGKSPLAVIQINHGLAEHSLRYARFSEFLADRGFAVYAHDHRGHGYTTAPDAMRGSFARTNGVQAVIADTAAVHGLILRRHPGSPVIVFGHSMGGLIALNYVLKHSRAIAGAAIWNANFSAGLAGRAAQALLIYERMRLGSDVPSRLLPKLTFQAWARTAQDRQNDCDWLTHDRTEAEAYATDPLCGWDATVAMWQDVFQMVFNGARERTLKQVRRDLPFHLAGGNEDPATNNGAAVLDLAQRLRAGKFNNVTHKIYAGTRHEGLNELNRDTIMQDFAAWAEQVATRSARE
ncbi:MAG: alpha/beta fold hydrolase [Phyllobacterium sp.]